MDRKPDPKHLKYLEMLRNLGPAGRFEKAMYLSRRARELFLYGLRKKFPNRTEEEIHEIFLERLATCHNQKVKLSISLSSSSIQGS